MFPLYQKELPRNADELAATLESSLRRVVTAMGKIVSIREEAYPKLDEIAINLNDAQISGQPARPSFVADKTRPAMTVNRLAVTAQRVSLDRASLDLSVHAQNVVLHQGRDKNGDVVLLLQRAENGRIAISMQQKDLEMMVGQIAKIEAAKQGITVNDVRLTLKLINPRFVEGEVRLCAQRFFLRAAIRIAGKLAIDEQLIARIFDLTCTGEGAIAALACSVLEPHLQKLSGRRFDLLALPLGEAQIREVCVEVDSAIKITAEFGATQE